MLYRLLLDVHTIRFVLVGNNMLLDCHPHLGLFHLHEVVDVICEDYLMNYQALRYGDYKGFSPFHIP